MNEFDIRQITLKKIEEKNVSTLFKLIQKNPEITKYLSWTVPNSLREMKIRHKELEQKETEKKLIRFGIFYEKSLIGAISINNIIHKSGRRNYNSGELGYWISPDYSGQGFTTKAAQKMLEYGFKISQLQKIKAACVLENIASEKILQKIGMRYVGMRKDHYFEMCRW